LGFEDVLWKAADKLRGSQEAAVLLVIQQAETLAAGDAA
jgi:hypothetical protein